MRAGAVLCTFEDSRSAGEALASALRLPCQLVDCHHFPDGESRVRLDPVPRRAVVYRALQHPNDKLIELLLLASVLQGRGGIGRFSSRPTCPTCARTQRCTRARR